MVLRNVSNHDDQEENESNCLYHFVQMALHVNMASATGVQLL
jgi:hypothetical protein